MAGLVQDKPGHDALLGAQIILKILHLRVAFAEQNRAWRVICAPSPHAWIIPSNSQII
jgi:hypothetical protein